MIVVLFYLFIYLLTYVFIFRDMVFLCHRLKCSSTIITHCSLKALGSSNSPTSASRVAEITGMRHHAWLILVFLVATGFYHVDETGLKLLTSSDPAA